jgi:prepilin-type N-terminal cleavage/methylation domain-containing protein
VSVAGAVVKGRVVQVPEEREPLQGEAGMTLAEVMVAILVLGVVLSGFAAAIMGSLRAINLSEREVRATSLAQQSVEEFQSIDWEAAGLYTNEVTAAPTAWNGGDTLTYDGDDLVLLPSPAADARLAQVPMPRSESVQGNVTYTVDRYITWVDGDNDGTRETKRFTALVTWPDRSGGLRSLLAVGDRVPTQAEAPSTSVGVRVLSISGAPDPSMLDEWTGKNLEDLTVTVRLNEGVQPTPTPKVTFYSLDDDDQQTYVLRTLTLTGSELADNNYRGRWTGTVPAGEYHFANGALNLLFTATDAAGDLLEVYGAVQMQGGKYEHSGTPPRPPRESDDGVAFPNPPTLSDTDEGGSGPPGDVRLQNLAVNAPICVEKSTWRLTKPIEVTINVKGLTEADGTVEATYKTWTETKPNSTKVVTDTASYSTGSSSAATYRLTIATTAERLFRPGQSVTFEVKASRGDGANHTMTSSAASVSDSC